MFAHSNHILSSSRYPQSTPSHPFDEQSAKLATFHMRFHFTYYIHIVNRWNMICFSSSHILLSGRDRLLSFFSFIASMKKKMLERNIECHKSILSNKLLLLLGLNACIIIKVHQFETGYCLLLLRLFVWPKWPFSAFWHLNSWPVIFFEYKKNRLLTIELHNNKAHWRQCIWAFETLDGLHYYSETCRYRNHFFFESF